MREGGVIAEIVRADTLSLLKLLFRFKLVKSEQVCLFCKANMSLKPFSPHIDGFAWRCKSFKCSKYQSTLSVRLDSVLEQFKTCSRTILLAVFYIPVDLQRLKFWRSVVLGRKA